MKGSESGCEQHGIRPVGSTTVPSSLLFSSSRQLCLRPCCIQVIPWGLAFPTFMVAGCMLDGLLFVGLVDICSLHVRLPHQ